ncbi:MAG: hypothetical protein B6245_13685, partial [Desulfobacteraceae bacterium 4572_88]
LLEEKKEDDATKADTAPAGKAPKPGVTEADSAGVENPKTSPDKNQKPEISGGNSGSEDTEAPAENSESESEGESQEEDSAPEGQETDE